LQYKDINKTENALPGRGERKIQDCFSEEKSWLDMILQQTNNQMLKACNAGMMKAKK
jgi:hypothetical protein